MSTIQERMQKLVEGIRTSWLIRWSIDASLRTSVAYKYEFILRELPEDSPLTQRALRMFLDCIEGEIDRRCDP